MLHFENYFTDSPLMILLFVFLIIWELIWKGIALWKSARNNHTLFFVLCLVTNTAGILPIIYILMNKKKGADEK